MSERAPNLEEATILDSPPVDAPTSIGVEVDVATNLVAMGTVVDPGSAATPEAPPVVTPSVRPPVPRPRASVPPKTEVAPPVVVEETPAPPVQSGVGVGDRIAGKYVVTEVLGRGGMGQVLAAKHVELGTMVAIKVVLPEALGDATIARFKREALAMARLRSEHAVRILDVGDANGMPFIMMEYLEGNDLSSELRRRGPLPIREAVRYVLEAIDVLAEAHDMGIVHRDLKPGNLFLSWRPSGTRSIRVLDFGIAKPMVGAPMPNEDESDGRAPGKLTMAGMTLGTPHFMAPEQVSSGAIGPHTDVWGVGATLYTLVTGAFPFTGPTVSLICGAVCSLPPIAPRERRPDIPKELEAIILKCLEKSPNRRFLSIRELAASLGHALNVAPPPTTMGLRVPAARERGPEPTPEPTPADVGASRTPSKPPPRSKRMSDPHGSVSAQFATSHTTGDATGPKRSDRPAPTTSSRRVLAVVGVVGLVLAGAATVELLVSPSDAVRGSVHGSSAATSVSAAARALAAKITP